MADCMSSPILFRHEVVNLPSASVLAVQRRALKRRPSASLDVAVLADPVFDQRDPRVRNPTSSHAGAHPPTGTLKLERLPSTREEAEAIEALLPRGHVLTALDFAASRSLVLDRRLGEYRIVHLATHGLINARNPELSGLALSMVDEKGQPRDGFVRLHDLYNLELRADLVVLSGCQMALGKEVRGEGLVGLTRGFMYAGVPRVVAGLWRVQDRVTAELMKRFYRSMLVDGLRPAAALRAAQLSIERERQWRDPYYWAPFVLQGDWR